MGLRKEISSKNQVWFNLFDLATVVISGRQESTKCRNIPASYPYFELHHGHPQTTPVFPYCNYHLIRKKEAP